MTDATVAMTCRHCGTEITADDEERLVEDVQHHVSTHDAGHIPSREHVLRRLRRRQPGDATQLNAP